MNIREATSFSCRARGWGGVLRRFVAPAPGISALFAFALATSSCGLVALDVYEPSGEGTELDRSFAWEREPTPAHLLPNGVNDAGIQRFERRRDGMEVLHVAPQPAIMGRDDGPPAEGPQHERFVPGFYIDAYEVTNGQYAVFLEAVAALGKPETYDHPDQTPRRNHRPPGWEDVERDTLQGGPAADLPVVGVDWYDAWAYSRWANETTSRACLPLEEEWELAARGATRDPYPWGAQPPTRKLCNFGISGNPGAGELGPVGAWPKGKSAIGAYGLAGNASEWTLAPFRETYRFGGSAPFPDEVALRGGGFKDFPDAVRATARRASARTARAPDIGFRCVWRSRSVPEDSIVGKPLPWAPRPIEPEPTEPETSLGTSPGATTPAELKPGVLPAVEPRTAPGAEPPPPGIQPGAITEPGEAPEPSLGEMKRMLKWLEQSIARKEKDGAQSPSEPESGLAPVPESPPPGPSGDTPSEPDRETPSSPR